jgi:L-fuconolactonase
MSGTTGKSSAGVRIDGAVHIWSRDAVAYPWAPHDGHELPEPQGTVESLLQTLDANGFTGAVCVQPRVYGYDHAYLIGAVHAHRPRLAGVCLVNPVRPFGPRELEVLVVDHGMSGVRLLPLAQRNPQWFVDASGDPLWRAANDLGIVVSVLVRAEQIALVESRARQFPDARIVVDHLGSAPTGGRTAIDDLIGLSGYPNVCVKVSALSFFAATASWEATEDAARAARDSFGPDRVVFGTDWPYSTENVPWSDELVLLERALGSRADESGLLGENAARLWMFGQ